MNCVMCGGGGMLRSALYCRHCGTSLSPKRGPGSSVPQSMAQWRRAESFFTPGLWIALGVACLVGITMAMQSSAKKPEAQARATYHEMAVPAPIHAASSVVTEVKTARKPQTRDGFSAIVRLKI